MKKKKVRRKRRRSPAARSGDAMRVSAKDGESSRSSSLRKARD